MGEILQRARLEKKYSIQDVEIAIRVSAQHITAIEENRLEVLPGRIYALGFIKSYAELVDLDSYKILELLKIQSGTKLESKEVLSPPSEILEDFSLPTLRIFVIILVLFFMALGGKSFFVEPRYLLNEEIPRVPKDLIAQTTLLSKPEKPKTIEVKAEIEPIKDAVVPLTEDSQIVLKAVGNVWLEIRDSSKKTVFSRVLSAGEEYWIPKDQTGLTMTLGNAGGLQIMIDGQVLPFLGKTGQVIRKVALDIEKLKLNLKTPDKKTM